MTTSPTSVFAGLAQESTNKLGKHDDNLEGAILTKIAQGDLVRVPLPNTIVTSAVGSSTASHGTTQFNPDGSQHGYTLTVPAGLTQGASLKFTAYGRIIGIRASRASTTTPPWSVKVDGVIYGVRNTQARRNAQPASYTDYESLFIVNAADLLTDGPHTVEIGLASEPSVTRSVTVFGLLVEASKGYSAYPQVGLLPSTPQAITTSATSITASGFAVRKLHFYNTSAADRTVTIQISSNIIKKIVVPTASPSSAEYDFGQPVDLLGVNVLADAVGVNMYAQQGVRTR